MYHRRPLGLSMTGTDGWEFNMFGTTRSRGDSPQTGTAGPAPAQRSADATAPSQWIYQNLTPWRIHACFTADGTLVPRGDERSDGLGCGDDVVKVLSVPALGETIVPDKDARRLNTLAMRRLGQIALRPAPSELLTHLPRAIVIYGWLCVGLVLGGWALFFGGASALPSAWFVAAFFVVPVVALTVATAREIHVYRRFTNYQESLCGVSSSADDRRDGVGEPGSAPPLTAVNRSVEGVERSSRIRTFVDGVPRKAAEVTVFVGAVAVSAIGLGVAIHLTTQLNDLLPIDYGAAVRLANPFEDVTDLARTSPAFWQLLVGHVAQWILVAIAALAPAAMYFQFDRQRLSSIQRRWVQEVFRLDPTVRTVRDIEAKYGSQIEASFGDLSADSGLRQASGRRSPVIVATILLVVGWFLVIAATQVPGLIEVPIVRVGPTGTRIQESMLVWPPSGAGAPGAPAVGTDGSFPVSTFFRPDLSLVGYAFLGAYVFTLFHVIRGYHRRDLHPKAYNTIVVRILAAYAMALVVSVVYAGPAAEVVMFFVGFMPQSALVWLREKLSRNDGLWEKLPLHEPAPLTELEGIDLYDRTRLSEEGISNIEALAHADIVDLMSSTRISAAELVDWTDQAILYLRVGGDALAQSSRGGSVVSLSGAGSAMEMAGATATTATIATAPDVRANLCHLRRFGIRTASDLLQVYEEALRRGGDDQASRRAEVELLREALELPGAPERTRMRTIQTIIDSLPDEEWFMQIRNWRNPEFGSADAWYFYLDGHDWQLTRSCHVPHRVEEAMRPFESVPMIEARPTVDAPAGDRSTDAGTPSQPTRGRPHGHRTVGTSPTSVGTLEPSRA